MHDFYFNSFFFIIMSYVDRVHCRDMLAVQIKDASIYLSMIKCLKKQVERML